MLNPTVSFFVEKVNIYIIYQDGYNIKIETIFKILAISLFFRHFFDSYSNSAESFESSYRCKSPRLKGWGGLMGVLLIFTSVTLPG